jgi:hypothetical protein
MAEKSNVLMLLQAYWDLELKVSSKSLEFWISTFEYLWRPVLTAVKIEVKILERGLVDHFAAPEI